MCLCSSCHILHGCCSVLVDQKKHPTGESSREVFLTSILFLLVFVSRVDPRSILIAFPTSFPC